MKRLFAVLALAASVMVGGCSIKPQNLAGCQIPRRQLAVNHPAASPGQNAGEGTLAFDLRRAVENRTGGTRAPGDDAMLFMSGGSENGAFGAGLLKGWQAKRPGGLPRFAVVTGVSTGSILATFAFVGDSDGATRGYTIDREGELLNPYVKPDASGGIGASAALALARKGSIADLAPLRVRLAEAYTPQILAAVAKGQAEGRKLFVGAVDVDTGEGVAFDLTLLAERWANAGPAEQSLVKSCYIEAIIASSSSPIAAQPVFIDSRMYVDGGMRFGVFSDEIGKSIKDRVSASGPTPGPKPVTYVIINGDQKLKQLCPWENCPAGVAPPTTLSNEQHRKWNFPTLALRSEKILVNQIYLFSAASIQQQAAAQGKTFRYFQIDDDVAGFAVALPDVDDRKRTCAEWTAYDAAQSNPLQFFPHYMRCMIAYGEDRAKNTVWDPA